MSEAVALSAKRVFDGEAWHKDAALIVRGGAVEAIIPRAKIPAGAEIVEAGDMLTPGFVDLQVNGGGGVMLNDHTDVEGIETICRAHAPFGTTALLPTLITDTPEVTANAVAAGIEAARKKVPGFAGLHLEGPHLSIARKGAHDPKLIRPMGDADLEALIGARKELPALLTTVAPESVTPPPPFTCRSTKPGASMSPASTMSAPAGISRRATIPSTTAPRTTSAASSCQASPSKMRLAERASISLISSPSPCAGSAAGPGSARDAARRPRRRRRTTRSASAGR